MTPGPLPPSRAPASRASGPLAAVVAAIALFVLILGPLAGSGGRVSTVSPIEPPDLAETPTPTTPSPTEASTGVEFRSAFDLAPGTWGRLPDAPLASRSGHSAVWTGSELVVFGGSTGAGMAGAIRGDGAAYSARTGAWRMIALPPAGLAPRLWHSAIWTGSEMIVWGGYIDAASYLEGAAYDPANDTWRPLVDAGHGERWGHSTVWTGSEMIVWGGSADPAGLAYSPGSDLWRTLPPAPIPPRQFHTAVWTGREMVVWGGSTTGTTAKPASGAAYDPVADTWRTIPDAPIGGRSGHAVAWTGREMVVWGGSRPVAAAELEDGARYEPATDTWRVLPAAPIPSRRAAVAAASGDRFFVWGGEQSVIGFDGYNGEVLVDGAVFDLAGDRWSPLPEAPSRGSAAALAVWSWTPPHLLIWGQDRLGQEIGLAYRP